MSIDDIEVGDYVTYSRDFKDGPAWGVEHGAGYVKILDTDKVLALIQNGNREFWVPLGKCEMHAKQFRLTL